MIQIADRDVKAGCEISYVAHYVTESPHRESSQTVQVLKFMKALRGAQKTNRMIHNRHSKLKKLVHKKDVHVHKERKQLISRVEVEANFSMVCT